MKSASSGPSWSGRSDSWRPRRCPASRSSTSLRPRGTGCSTKCPSWRWEAVSFDGSQNICMVLTMRLEAYYVRSYSWPEFCCNPSLYPIQSPLNRLPCRTLFWVRVMLHSYPPDLISWPWICFLFTVFQLRERLALLKLQRSAELREKNQMILQAKRIQEKQMEVAEQVLERFHEAQALER